MGVSHILVVRASWVLSFMKKIWAVFCFYNIPEIITDVALGAGGAAVAALFPKWITSQQVSSVKSENDVIFCLKTSEITSLYWTCFLEYEDDPDWDKQRHHCPWLHISSLLITSSLLSCAPDACSNVYIARRSVSLSVWPKENQKEGGNGFSFDLSWLEQPLIMHNSKHSRPLSHLYS